MAVPRKLVVVPSTTTRELWRIVESGEMDELYAVLARADINARNEHGMTALMRAAYHGRVQMVRVLLEHGADPNVMRNDKFTALSLAAFFGHAEIVDVLIEHGAKTDVTTRFGTSPCIWARARSFGDVARTLEKRSVTKPTEITKRPGAEKPVSVSRIAEPEPPPVVVRTLKSPPEIWDLVQEAPRNFDARAAFVARIGSLKTVLVIAIVLLVVLGAGAGAMFSLKDRGVGGSVSAPAAATVTVPAPVVGQTVDTTDVERAPAPVAPEPLNPEVNTTTTPRRSRSFPKPIPVLTETNNEQSTVEAGVGPPPVIPPKPESQSPATPGTRKSTTPLGSQTISGPKTVQPKAKVIQWP